MQILQVVTGILKNAQSQVLIACRPPSVISPGLWEFPGGKVEPKETLLDALIRELDEEIGVSVANAKPFMTLEHDCPKRPLVLNCFEVLSYKGEPYGKEDQQVCWANISALTAYDFLKANAPIIKALQNRDS